MVIVRTFVEGFERPVYEITVEDGQVEQAQSDIEKRIKEWPIFSKGAIRHEVSPAPLMSWPVGTPLRIVVRQAIEATVLACGGNMSRAAEAMKISPRTVASRLREVA